MAYAFDLSDSHLTASLRRILQKELGDALAQLDRIDQPEAVHGLRKNLKKTRALLRLLRGGLATQPAMNSALREIGLALSARRDAQVRLATLDRLFPDTPEALQPLRKALGSDPTAPSTVSTPDLRVRLAALVVTAQTLHLSGKNDRILREGLSVTRERARHAAHAARAAPHDAERIHDWRKRAKDHWYQSRLFAPCWPDLFRPIVASADRLGELLGDHHDLSLLAAHVAGLPDETVPDLGLRLLDSSCREAQARIEAEAFPLSARLFAGDPDEVAALWVDWRRVWRGKDGLMQPCLRASIKGPADDKASPRTPPIPPRT
jgi:CHAD domain-containing protein